MSSSSASSSTHSAFSGLGSSSSIPEWVGVVREKVEGLRFGVVQLVVHDGRVTQIDRTEKTRLEPGRDS